MQSSHPSTVDYLKVQLLEWVTLHKHQEIVQDSVLASQGPGPVLHTYPVPYSPIE